jgi:hypothetical protein
MAKRGYYTTSQQLPTTTKKYSSFLVQYFIKVGEKLHNTEAGEKS